jgi:hypothetical protein
VAGVIDEVRLYNRALSPDEIEAEFREVFPDRVVYDPDVPYPDQGPQGFAMRSTGEYPAEPSEVTMEKLGHVSIRILPPVLHVLGPDDPETGESAYEQKHFPETAEILAEYFEMNGYATPVLEQTPLVFPVPDVSQWYVFDQGYQHVRQYVAENPIDEDYLLVMEALILPNGDGEGVWGIECYMLTSDGLDVLSFVLNGEWHAFNKYFMFSEGRSAVERRSLVEMAARTVATALQTHINPDSMHLLPEVVDGAAEPISFGGHTYQLMGPATTWDSAAARCKELGGHLLHIDSAEENAFVVDAFVLPYGGIMLGATDAEREGSWRWSDGSRLRYKNWARGEPNDAEGGEDYAQIWEDGKWNDIGAFHACEYFVCEWDQMQ